MDRQPKRMSTGVAGLDEILDGGLMPGRSYVVRGGPGTGKTTLGLHFLAAGAAVGESPLFIALKEREAEVRANAETMGFDLKDIVFLDLSPAPEFFAQAKSYDIFAPSEVELEPTTKRIVEQVESQKPRRVFIDSMAQFRYLAADAYQFRTQVLSFLRFLIVREATVMLASEGMADEDLQFMADGIIELSSPLDERSVRVVKFRGSDHRGGLHSMRITSAGMQVYPRLVPAAHRTQFVLEMISSGVPEVDELLHGGLERGTVTIITGASGVGKTTVGLQFMEEAAGRGERSVVYSFEEEAQVMLAHCEGVGIAAREMVERGTLSLVKVEPLLYSPDEFALLVRNEVEKEEARIIMLDSISGYHLSLRGGDIVAHMHALAKYMANMGVTVLLINDVEAVTGELRVTDVGISYLADTVLFLRYMERRRKETGVLELGRAIGVLKKRLSDFDPVMREFEITREGIKVLPPNPGLTAILSGTPTYTER
jgi:circadian clock protein KaiC